MTLPPFTLHRPTSAVEAVGLLAEHGDDAAVYMGGTELLLVMKLGLAQPAHLVDCKRAAELHGLVIRDDRLEIGAGVTHRQLERHPQLRERLPALVRLAASVANVRVRTAGTLGGNLCFAEPHSDPATLLIALGAFVELLRPDGFRRVQLEEFVRGPLETLRQPEELMTRVVVPLPDDRAALAYERIKFRERPVANVAIRRDAADTRVVVGAVSGKPTRVTEAERILADDPMAGEAAGAAAAHAIEPYEDLDGSPDYKRHLVDVLLRRAVGQMPVG